MLTRRFLIASLACVVFGSACASDNSGRATAGQSSPTAQTAATSSTAAAATAQPAATAQLVAAAQTAPTGQATAITQGTAKPEISSAPNTATPQATPTTRAVGASQSASGGSDLRSGIRQVARQVRPAIVQITNLQQQSSQFLGGGVAVPSGVGSGVIYDAQGHILTNNHVISGAQQLQVSLPDRRSFPAKVVGADPQTDLAVVQIQADDLPVATLGDSSQLEVGDWVVAIGNALALPGGPTVTRPSTALRRPLVF